MSAIDTATYPRALRCRRFLAVLAVCTVFCGGVTALLVNGEFSSRSNPTGLGRVVLAVAFGLLTVVCLLCLRARVVVEETGVRVVWAFHQRRLPWEEITEITADGAGPGQGWYLQIRTAASEHMAAVYFTPRWSAPEKGTRLYEPSGDEPYGLYKLHAELHEEWRARVS